MAFLPTETNLATRDDLVDLEARLGARIDGLGARIDQVETGLGARMDEFNRRLDRFFLTMVTGLFAMVASLIAAVFIG